MNAKGVVPNVDNGPPMLGNLLRMLVVFVRNPRRVPSSNAKVRRHLLAILARWYAIGNDDLLFRRNFGSWRPARAYYHCRRTTGSFRRYRHFHDFADSSILTVVTRPGRASAIGCGALAKSVPVLEQPFRRVGALGPGRAVSHVPQRGGLPFYRREMGPGWRVAARRGLERQRHRHHERGGYCGTPLLVTTAVVVA